jgi:glycosyltransferase involved in cell wall biosynthesis
MSGPIVSIIVPVLNESGLIRPFLERLRSLAPGAEIIVVDGGSNDGTAELSSGLADRVLNSSPGRARQMNAGAQVAHADVFWFLHADSLIPPNALEEIATILRETSNVGGCFRLKFRGREMDLSRERFAR